MKNNSLILVFLSLFSILVLFYGIFRIRNHLIGPFLKYQSKLTQVSKEDLVSYLSEKDTDQDGLSDYDERYIYQTSAYLKDSDSDGYSDQEEIKAKSNPLNPESTPINIKSLSEKSILYSAVVGKKKEPQKSSSNFSSQEIRQFLIENGLSPEVVNKIDDQTLISVYNETVKELGQNPLKEKSKNNQQSLEFSNFKNLSLSQLRQLLIQQGLSEEIVNQISDKDLEKIYQEILNQ